jgi:hypothetical protein
LIKDCSCAPPAATFKTQEKQNTEFLLKLRQHLTITTHI